jgi:hypothetical protein
MMALGSIARTSIAVPAPAGHDAVPERTTGATACTTRLWSVEALFDDDQSHSSARFQALLAEVDLISGRLVAIHTQLTNVAARWWWKNHHGVPGP